MAKQVPQQLLGTSVIEALTDMGENTAADQVKAGRPKKPLPETGDSAK